MSINLVGVESLPYLKILLLWSKSSLISCNTIFAIFFQSSNKNGRVHIKPYSKNLHLIYLNFE